MAEHTTPTSKVEEKLSQGFSLVDSTISDLDHALSSHCITAVDLLIKYLHRISRYDCRGSCLNSIPLLNPSAFEDAAASDDRRAAGRSLGPLDGIPYTVKDSYRVKSMTISNGAWTFRDLKASEDAFVVAQYRKAGAVLLGRTNMCPMAYGGMQRGLFGRAENPYNPDYLAAAFASGSSNGSGASTGASLATFGMGSETVSSGRSPASNNGLIAYNPSKGFISVRGVWPLYPTCDTVTPHTRTMDDMLQLLDVIAAEDEITKEDFWRDQQFVKIPQAWPDRSSSFTSLSKGASLTGKRIAVPEMYIGGRQLESGPPIKTSPEVIALWNEARKDLEAAGATVIITPEFPVIDEYQRFNATSQGQTPVHLPANWNNIERSVIIAHAWEDFLKTTNDPNLTTIVGIEPSRFFPQLPLDHPQIAYAEPTNSIHWSKLSSFITEASSDANLANDRGQETAIYSIPNLSEALHALEDMRKTYFESWLSQNNYDFVVFPAASDVGRSDADVNHKSAEHAWSNGVKYSNGVRALRHLGIPGVTVTMGLLEGKNVPMGLTFLGKAGSDVEILKIACAYEKISHRRVPPSLTPSLRTDWISDDADKVDFELPRVNLSVSRCTGRKSQSDGEIIQIEMEGEAKVLALPETTNNYFPLIEVYVDGEVVPSQLVQLRKGDNGAFRFSCRTSTPAPLQQDKRNQVDAKVARDSTMIIVAARSGDRGRLSGVLRLIHQSEHLS